MNNSYIQKFNQKRPALRSNREIAIDFLRGFAVFIMILAHTAFFFNDNSNIIKSIQSFGDTNAFVIFLFVSGVVTFITYQRKKSDWENNKKTNIYRLISLVIGYYLVAFVSYGSQFTTSTILLDSIKILTFQLVPGFTEFLLVFIVYGIIAVFFPKVLEIIGKNIIISISIGLGLYLLGFLMYFVDLSAPIEAYKLLLAGGENIYRFPLLQYFLVFSIGLSFGNFLSIQKNPSIRQQTYFQLFIVFLSLCLVGLLIKPYSIFTEFNDLERWPPTLLFMMVGLTVSMFSLFLFSLEIFERYFEILFNFISKLGKDAYVLFIIHIIILQSYDILFDFRTNNIVLFLAIFTIFLTICLILTRLYKSLFISKKKKVAQVNQTKLSNTESTTDIENDLNEEIANYNFYNQKENQPNRNAVNSNYQTKSNNILVIILVVIIISSAAFVIYFGFDIYSGSNRNFAKRDESPPAEFINKRELAATSWWNYDYSYQRKISIYNTAVFSDINQGEWLSIDLNHKELVQNNKSLADARDIRIVYLVENELFTIVPRQVTGRNTENARVAFQAVNDIPSKQADKRYFLYYGNFQADLPENNANNNFAQLDLINSIVSAERKSQLSIDINRTWVLKGLKDDVEQKLQITVNINSAPFSSTQTVDYRYRILNSKIEGKLFTDQDGKYYANIDVSELDSDIYHIQAVAQSSNDQVLSPKRSFIVSNPLFVTWTMDWEGLDARNDFLSAMARIANQYDIPISHYFNPRIYLALPPSRAKFLTDWVKTRANQNGDSIDLHLHMFYDMARASGVNPTETEFRDTNGNIIRTEPRPRWGSPNTEGYDVIMTSYTEEETMKVLDWALRQFQAQNLPEPKGFRAGGWYLDLENMRALENKDFKFDSSGRTSFIWGANRLTNPWNLKSITQPYYPSRTNQNSSNPPPNFNVLQFPNNGADSYSFSADQMIQRFEDNYDGTYLEQKRIVTYLSHPHWFNIDESKLDKLFTHIGNHLYKNDQGPVVYIDMDDAYYYWTEQE